MPAMANNNPTINRITHLDVLQGIDDHTQSLVEEWKGSIPLTLYNSSGFSKTYDLCNNIGKFKHDAQDRLYFDTSKYPPPVAGIKNIPKGDPILKTLKLDLIRIAHDAGSPIIANGTKRQGQRKFVCICHRMYKADKRCPKKQDPFREDSLVNSDKKGRRANGRASSRRLSTKRALDPNKICKFRFQIGWDGKGYFLNQVAGKHISPLGCILL
jgi:hypothetical protein